MRALIKAGLDRGERLEILEAVEKTNQVQRQNVIEKMKTKLGADLKGKTIAIWGVAFKPGTDDIRDAPALDMIQEFLDCGATVNVYDPVAADNAKEHFAGHPNLVFSADQYSILQNASALAILTEWKSFKEPNFEKMRGLMKKPIIFDGRNLFSLKLMREMKFQYYSIGRKPISEVPA